MIPILIKVSGHELDDDSYLRQFAEIIRDMASPTVIVHGGGKEISALQERFNIQPQYVDGVRVTDVVSLAIAQMALCGVVNKRLVRQLVFAGIEALGMCGIDRALIRADKMAHPTIDMGYSGQVTHVRAELLMELLAQGVTPIIAPICLGPDSALNVNADHVAGAVAIAIGARRIVFLTNVEGVIVSETVCPRLTVQQADALIADGVITGGMIPKVKTVLSLVQSGVTEVAITNLMGLKTHGGTIISQL